MSKSNTRIRWTEDERSTILTAYRTAHARDPHADMEKLFDTAQKALPPKRRRALDYKLRVWLGAEGAPARRRSPAANVPGTPSSSAASAVVPNKGAPPEASMQDVPVSATPRAKRRPARDDAHAAASAAAPDSVALAELLVERGSEVIADILTSPRVQSALRALLQAAWPTASSGAPGSVLLAGDGAAASDDQPVATAHSANGKLRILIAGMDKSEGGLFAKTYDDTLELVCWSADEGLERLRAAVDRADVVVGMTNALSQPVEQTLRRYAKRYLRNARGVAGLRGELAELVLSGHGGTAN
jgi:hypothetical protein